MPAIKNIIAFNIIKLFINKIAYKFSLLKGIINNKKKFIYKQFLGEYMPIYKDKIMFINGFLFINQ